jgi:hypothetical protein
MRCATYSFIYIYTKERENHSLCRHVGEVLAGSENDKITEDFDEIQKGFQANLIA